VGLDAGILGACAGNMGPARLYIMTKSI